MYQIQNLLTRLSRRMVFHMTDIEATRIAKQLQAEWNLQHRKWKNAQALNAAVFLVAVFAVFVYTGWKL